MIRQYRLLLSIALFTGVALFAVAQGASDEAEQNRQRLETLRKNPELLAKLRANVQQFNDLLDKRREKIIQLDQELHAWPPAKKARYFAVLERYADWLDQLRQDEPAVFKSIREAPNAEIRLAVIQERRDSEWMQSQPKAQQEEWKKLSGPARTEFVAKLRNEDRMRHYQWVVAQRFWKELETKKELPCRLSDFSDKVKTYVKDYLLPKLTEKEKKKLADAEGHWPDYPMALVEIAGKRPTALPPARPEEAPRNFADLPEPVRKYLTEPKKPGTAKSKVLLKQYMQLNGDPHFASQVVALAAKDGKAIFDYEYLASSHKALLKPMKEYVDTKLMPVLREHPEDDRKLRDAHGKWPDYPDTIRELAQKHNLPAPPWHFLPEPERWKWDSYRYLKRPLETVKESNEP